MISSYESRPRKAAALPGVVSTPICASRKDTRSALSAGVVISRSPRLASLTTRIRFRAPMREILVPVQLSADGIQDVVDAEGEHARGEGRRPTRRRFQLAARHA